MTAPEPPNAPRRTLIVDDDIVALIVVKHMLESMGLEVVQAANVRAAKALLDNESFDLIISDYLMPEETGLDLLDATGDLPFILLSGVLERDDNSDSRLDGVTSHLTKPVSTDELRSAVIAALPSLAETNDADA